MCFLANSLSPPSLTGKKNKPSADVREGDSNPDRRDQLSDLPLPVASGDDKLVGSTAEETDYPTDHTIKETLGQTKPVIEEAPENNKGVSDNIQPINSDASGVANQNEGEPGHHGNTEGRDEL